MGIEWESQGPPQSGIGTGAQVHGRGAPEPGGFEERLRQQVDRDALTGLYNRRRFDEELAAHLEQTPAQPLEPSALLLIDVDAFRFVNDSLGHQAGDQLLREIGARLHHEARDEDFLARIGGDEFALLLRRASREDAVAVANRLIEAIKATTQTATGVSIGIATFDETAGDLDGSELLIAADIALFEAKEAGRGQAIVYAGQRGRSLTWVARIREAIDDDRLVVYAQPIVDLEQGSVVRDELLVRMLDHDGDVIPPASFLPTAERFGLIEEIDRLVLAKALALAGHVRPMAMNLSGHSLASAQFLDDVRSAIDSGLDPSWLSFEITETAAVARMDEAEAFARSLTALGFSLGLDDFGAGFSSFSYLKHLPIDYVKIDMEFIRDVRWNAFDQRLVQAMVDISHALNIKTVAEGVEDAETVAIVKGLGVDQVQGFYVGRPYVVAEPRAAREPG
jgi:diguanylate cyclase (GGDEF)-like protein